jgi:succinate dehydrogenase / fumarate reductase flavoprotein subunit/fumarate reductase flavoprotein subunit
LQTRETAHAPSASALCLKRKELLAVTTSTGALRRVRSTSTLRARSEDSGVGESVRAADCDYHETDIAIVGSGGAGLMAALRAKTAEPRLRVSVFSKGAIGRSGCTRMVQGGFNAALGPQDSIETHFRDTIEGGHYLNDQDLAWTLVSQAPSMIDELETSFGCLFDRTTDGHLQLKAFGGQSHDRTVHRGDQTGLEIMGRLRDQLLRWEIHEYEYWRGLDLVFDPHGELAGFTALDMISGAPAVILARAIVIATGGAATMYRVAAPAREKTGDGVAMCFRAGLELRDMEMLQFHPTGLVAGSSVLTGSVLEEGLRGAGARLYNAQGERFMERYDPARLERSTRDVVARASYLEIIEGRGTPAGGVLLDISHLGAELIEQRFQGMLDRTRLIGSDLASGPVEVCPTAHFHMGGVVIDTDCATAMPGLFVAGEDAGGVHGANRLGGNGVAESIVYGARAGERAVEAITDRALYLPSSGSVEASLTRTFSALGRGRESVPTADRLKEVMWEHCGLVRTRAGLCTARESIESLEDHALSSSVPSSPHHNLAWQQVLDLQNQLVAARLVVESALIREESRGAHHRSDHPQRDDASWLRTVLVRASEDGQSVAVTTRPVELTRLRPGQDALVEAGLT